MIRIVIILLLISAQTIGQTILTKPYRTFTPHGEEYIPDPLEDHGTSVTYHYNNLSDEWDNVGEVVAEIIDTVIALPASGWIEVDKLYKWEGIIVRCRQSHNRTIYDPTETLALFTIYRPVTEDMSWIAGEKVDVGTVRIYNSIEYECIQAHVTQSDWTPDVTATLWRVPAPPTEAWAVGVAYKVGDIVTYNGQTYSCRQAHTSISTWYPSAVPALWLLVE